MPLTYLKRRFFVTLLIFRYQSFTRCLRKHVLFKFLFVWRADWIDRRKVSVLNLDYNFKRISQLIRLNCMTFNKCIDAYLTRFQPQGTGGFKKKILVRKNEYQQFPVYQNNNAVCTSVIHKLVMYHYYFFYIKTSLKLIFSLIFDLQTCLLSSHLNFNRVRNA